MVWPAAGVPVMLVRSRMRSVSQTTRSGGFSRSARETALGAVAGPRASWHGPSLGEHTTPRSASRQALALRQAVAVWSFARAHAIVRSATAWRSGRFPGFLGSSFKSSSRVDSRDSRAIGGSHRGDAEVAERRGMNRQERQGRQDEQAPARTKARLHSREAARTLRLRAEGWVDDWASG